MSKEYTVKLVLTGDGNAAVAAVEDVAKATKEVGASATTAGKEASSAFDKIDQSATKTVSSVKTARAANDDLRASANQFLADAKKLEAMMQSQATTLDDIAERRRAYDAGLQKGLLTENEHVKALAGLEKQEGRVRVEMDRHAASVEALARKYAPADAALKRIEQDERKLNDALAAGTITQERYARAMQGLTVQRARWRSEQQGIKETSDALGKLTLSSRDAVSSYSLVARQLATGDWRGASQGILSAANSTGVLRASLLGMGATIGLVVGTVATLGIAAYKGARDNYELERALIASGGAAGKNAGELLRLGDAVGRSTGQYGNARLAVLALAQSGKVAGDQLRQSAELAVNFATVTGRSMEESAKAITQLSAEPVRAIQELDAQYNVINLQTYERIKALQAEGRESEAAALANQAFAEEFAARAVELRNNLGFVDAALQKSKDIWDAWWDSVKGLGRPTTEQDEVDRLLVVIQGQRDNLEALKAEQAKPEGFFKDLVSGSVERGIEGAEKALEGLYQKLAAAKEKANAADIAAAAKATELALQKEGKAASDRIDALTLSLDKNLSLQTRLNKAAADLYSIHKAGGTLPEGISFDGPAADIPVGPGWSKLKQAIESASAAGKQWSRDQAAAKRDALALERAAAQQANALSALSNTTGALSGKVDPLTAEWEHHAAVLRRIGEEGGAAISAYDKVVETAAQAHVPLNTNLLSTAQIQALVTAAVNKAKAAHEGKVAAIERERDVTGQTLKALTAEAKLIGLTSAQARIESTVLHALAEAKRQNLAAGEDLVQVDEERIRQQATLNEALQIAADVNEKSPFEKMTADIELMTDALETVSDRTKEAFDPARAEELRRAIAKTNRELEQRNITLLQQGVSSLQTYAKEGTAAYTALGIAQDVLAYKSAVAAIANQGSGDPYSAFARIAAMIALMASIGLRVGGSGGGFTDTAAQRQATQGTGSVLGDAAAKSESIARAIEITADATTELVGINRGMLRALQSLQSGLSGASGMLARGAGEVDFGTFDPGFMLNARNGAAMGAVIGSIIPVVGTLVGAVIGGVLGSILGGSSRLTDQGIAIGGGSINDANFSAYQEHQVRSWRFGSRRTVEQTAALPDDVANQFQLVMDSIVDTVREGALALGLVPADIEAAIAAYQVEATRISLKGLSAEEQQAELAAVFSQIFDGLAGQVVPFIGQFQRLGEGLGETLVRVATEVQVMQEAVRYLGIAIDETDPERFAQISDDLIQRAGGLEAFITQMTSFADKFAPESYKLEVASDSLTAALAQVGLTVPDTEDGMWALMRSLDATTESGREQIATLLRLADTANQYYSLLDEAVSSATKFLESLGLAERPMSTLAQELLSIRDSGHQAIESANILAVAQGRQSASAIQLARIRQWTLDQEAAAIRRLQQRMQDLVAELFGGLPGSLDAVNAQIAELEAGTSNFAGGIDSLADAGANLFEQWRSGIQSVQDYLDSMLLGDLSALTPEQQLDEARRQLEAMQQAALGGDANALQQLPQLADAYLRLLRGFEASGNDYNAGFDWVRQLLQSVVGAPGPAAQTGGGAGAGGGTVQVAPSPELIALYERRDALLAEQEIEYRRGLAEELAQDLRDMATLMRTPILEFIQAQGLSLTELATQLGVDLQDLTASSVQALGNMAATLGISLTDLTGALGISLTDLSEGLRGLTEQVGIDLDNLTVESVESLALLATSLGANLSELATSLGVDLGDLADSQSLLNQALHDQLDTLPEAQRDQLAPLLQAVEDATNEADANAAITALEAAVNALAPDIRTQLAPYLAGVFPADALSDLDYLEDLQSIASDQLSELGLIRQNLAASNRAANIPSYAIGTGYVPRTGLATIHEGEIIIPTPFSTWMRTHGLPVSTSRSEGTVEAKLDAICDRLDRFDRNNVIGQKELKETVDRVGDRSDKQRDRALNAQADKFNRERSGTYGR